MSFTKPILSTDDVVRNQQLSNELLPVGSPLKFENSTVVKQTKPDVNNIADSLKNLDVTELQKFINLGQEILLTKKYQTEVLSLLSFVDALFNSPDTSMLVIRKIDQQLHKSIFHLFADNPQTNKLQFVNTHGEVLEMPIHVQEQSEVIEEKQ